MINIFIVSEIRLYREGLAQVLGHMPSLSVVGSAAKFTQIPETAGGRTDIVVLLDLSGSDAASGALAFLAENPRGLVVALGIADHAADVIACSEAGIAGYVTRDGSISELVRMIESVVRDELPCSPRIAAALNHRVGALAADRRTTGLEDRLSRREMEVLRLVNDGLTNREIARRLSIETATAKNHVHNILEKLDVRCRAQAAAWVRRQRIDSIDGPRAVGHRRPDTALRRNG